ncbi:hypothetical protein Tco_1248106, partial [Tanacetum coccineum]
IIEHWTKDGEKDVNTSYPHQKIRRGGNEATKKTQKTLLKQMYENFAPSKESFDSILTGLRRFPASTQVSTASTQVSTANLNDATVYEFLANQPNGSQLVHEDLEQIHEYNLEEMDLKWQLALLSMRTKRGPRNQDSRNRNQDNSRRTINVEETSSKADGNSRFDDTKETSDETKGPKRKAIILQKMEDFGDSRRSP